MEYYAEWRLRGDRYSDGYGNGRTLSSSESVQGMEKISENAAMTEFRGKKGHLLRVYHEKRGEVTVRMKSQRWSSFRVSRCGDCGRTGFTGPPPTGALRASCSPRT